MRTAALHRKSITNPPLIYGDWMKSNVAKHRSCCRRKVRYRTLRAAIEAAERSGLLEVIQQYECKWCGGYHNGRPSRRDMKVQEKEIMAEKETRSSFAKNLSARVSAANEEHKNKPVDLGFQRLPPGLNNAIAKLQSMVTREFEDDKNGQGTKGQTYFSATGVVVWPTTHEVVKISPDGIKTVETIHVENMTTTFFVPLCDTPAKGKKKAKTFSENWMKFQNLFKALSNNAIVCPETRQSDPTGMKTEAFYFAAMKALCDPQRRDPTTKQLAPVYFYFSTEDFSPTLTAAEIAAKQEQQHYTMEKWHGLAQWNGQRDPAAGVTVRSGMTAPSAPSAPPMPPVDHGPPVSPDGLPFSPPVTNGGAVVDEEPADLEAEVAYLVEVAMADPTGQTEDGKQSTIRLEDLAMEAGWTREQIDAAEDWARVGDMALNPPDDEEEAQEEEQEDDTPAIGSLWMFAKRTKDGERLKNARSGQPFPPSEVEVTSVDEANKTCTVKSARDGKDVIDIKSRKPANVKWEWLESK